MLQQNGYHVDFQLDRDGQIIYLLLIHPKSLAAYRKHAPDLLMSDRTYRTNQYGQPLLNIIGSTGSNHTLNLGVALLTGEAASDFTPVILSLRDLLHDCLPSVILTNRQLAMTNVLD